MLEFQYESTLSMLRRKHPRNEADVNADMIDAVLKNVLNYEPQRIAREHQCGSERPDFVCYNKEGRVDLIVEGKDLCVDLDKRPSKSDPSTRIPKIQLALISHNGWLGCDVCACKLLIPRSWLGFAGGKGMVAGCVRTDGCVGWRKGCARVGRKRRAFGAECDAGGEAVRTCSMRLGPFCGPPRPACKAAHPVQDAVFDWMMSHAGEHAADAPIARPWVLVLTRPERSPTAGRSRPRWLRWHADERKGIPVFEDVV